MFIFHVLDSFIFILFIFEGLSRTFSSAVITHNMFTSCFSNVGHSHCLFFNHFLQQLIRRCEPVNSHKRHFALSVI